METIARYEVRPADVGWCVWDLVDDKVVARPVQERAAAALAVELLNDKVDVGDELGVLTVIATVMLNTPSAPPARGERAADGGGRPVRPFVRRRRRGGGHGGVLDDAQSAHA